MKRRAINGPREQLPDEVQMETSGCPLGCVQDDEILFRGFDRLHSLPGVFSVVRCRECGLMRTNPRPDRESIGFYYPADYSPHRATDCGSGTRPGWRSSLARTIDYRATPIPSMRQGRLLEIGCGSGAFLKSMANEGWAVKGIEPGTDAAEVARADGMEVFTGRLEDAPEPTAPFDLIVGWMVIEHLHDPVAALRRLRGWIAADGWLVLSVPNCGSLEFRFFKDAWYALQLPTHLFHFTPVTIREVLRAAGWEIDRVIHQRILSNLVASAGYRLSDRGILPGLARRFISLPDAPGRHHQLMYPLALALGAFGQTGRMTVWARPTDPTGKP